MKKMIFATLSMTTIIVILYLFAYGRLVPFSPFLVGYEKTAIGNINVYKHINQPIPSAIYALADSLSDLEKTHRLKFNRSADIILCSSEGEQRRINGSDIRAKCYPVYGRVVVSHKLLTESIENKKNLYVYLKHELSHTLLFQNLSIAKSFYYFPRWLIEGLAVYSSNQFGIDNYYTKEKAAQTIREGKFFRPEWLNGPLQHESREALDFPLPEKAFFFYSEFGMIVDDLIAVYGEDNFHEYLRGLITDDSDTDTVFYTAFGISFNQYLVEFQKRIVGKFSP
jgi:hypothetical protein